MTSSDDDEPTYDYYSRARGLGIFHNVHLIVGLLSGEIPPEGMDGAPPTTDALASSTGLSAVFEATLLDLASIYGNYQGIETAVGLRSGPWDFYWNLGMPFTILNLGRGGVGSLRLGASFGFGLGLRHAYGYVRGRAAAVVIPEKFDLEASLYWVPESASSAYDGDGSLEDRNLRISGFWRRTGSTKAWEGYLEIYRRDRRGHDAAATPGMPFDGLDVSDEVAGVGFGVGYVW